MIRHSVGASWTLGFARRHPSSVDRVVLLSPNFLGDSRSTSIFASFLDGLKVLAARSGLLRYIAWQFRKHVVDERVLRHAWRRICRDSSDDLAVLDGRRGAGPIYGWFAAGFRASAGGVADDMVGAARCWHDELSDLPCGVTIVGAAEDPVAGYARDWDAVAAMPGVTLVRLAAGGHLVAASHANDAWAAVAGALDRRPYDKDGLSYTRLVRLFRSWAGTEVEKPRRTSQLPQLHPCRPGLCCRFITPSVSRREHTDR